ncbi:peptide/nickel transport system permease protein [Aureimonas altamirensis DSM 21988]|uniref:Peptide/nickel transport system permease protein n=2 Tax=Aureimonas altamirensis TaxID=370622 RepID=A0ABY1IND1_9HYPH|nr:peptide/nickel transport system permease protein [Aureimonas altamirensis DSM 21988]
MSDQLYSAGPTELELAPERVSRLAGMTLGDIVLRRVMFGLILLLAATLVIFLGTQVLPGDVATAILGQQATPEAVQNIRNALGLDQPAMLRYLQWLGGALTGDLGTSYSNGQRIADGLFPRLANTLSLAAMAAAVAVPTAIILGVISVLYRDRLLDKAINIVTLGVISLPEFFVGYLLITYASVQYGLAPSSAVVHDGMSFGERLWTMALPCATLVMAVLGHMMRMTRAALLNVMEAPFIETAQLKGLPAWRILYRHALPAALGPIISVVTLNLAYLVVGVVVVEVVFVYPGLGQYMVDHVAKRDIPVIQACGAVFAAMYIFLNVLADIAITLANPRLRYRR